MKAKPHLAVVFKPSLLAIALLAVAPVAAQAAGNFDPSPGSYTVDTSTMTLTGPGTSITGTDVGGIAVFSFGDVSIPVGTTITASGSRPLEIVASGSFDLSGTIDGSGTSSTVVTQGPYAGGPGGGQGGPDDSGAGTGPGGGSPGSTDSDGGGGGGFGGAGAAGTPDGGVGGAGGPAYGDLGTDLQGGSGGAGGSAASFFPVGGGGGGGGIELSAQSLTIAATGSVLANGGDGNLGGFGASGGGSGGGILLHADSIDVAGTISAAGGQGGAGSCCGNGGGGGGGRVGYQYVTLTAGGSPTVAGGTSGTSGAQPFASPRSAGLAAGASGVITMAQAASASTGAATSITDTSADLPGTVNPNGHPATYQFEYGTSTSYGNKTPSSPASAGSGSSAVSVSSSLNGLNPATTYHYRIVTYSLGFTITGADQTFTTTKTAIKTKGARPHVGTGRASEVKSTRARVSGSVNAKSTHTAYYFQYHASGHQTRATGARSAGSGSRSLNHSVVLSGLSPSTTYHYRIVAKNAFGTVRGSWRTFRTRATRAAAPPFTG